MAIIGIYEETYGVKQDAVFSVEAFHFNMWMVPVCLKSLDGYKNFFTRGELYKHYIDVGLRLTVSSGKLETIDFHLPCLLGKMPEQEDLYGIVLDEKINDLLFGTSVSSRNEELVYKRDEVEIKDKVKKISSIEPIKCGQDWRYRLTFTSPVEVTGKSKANIYLRFRYRCEKPNEILLSKGWGFAKRGFIIDLRVNDVRETLEYDTINQPNKMKNIKELNAFVICTTSFLPLNQSPDFLYTRILEPNAWDTYLKFCQPYNKANKFTIHQWKQNDVSYQKPFRAFVHLHKEFGWLVFFVYLLGLITPLVLKLLAWLLNSFLSP